MTTVRRCRSQDSDSLDLIEASEAGHYSKVKELVKKGTPINGTDAKGQSALHVAPTYKIASYLIHAKADVNLKDRARVSMNATCSFPNCGQSRQTER